MKALVLISLFSVGAFAIWKHHVHATAAKTPVNGEIPVGVSAYPSQPAAQQPQQILAGQMTNEDAVSEFGYSGAFGAYENQPGDGEELY
jgi:hypothetical protein